MYKKYLCQFLLRRRMPLLNSFINLRRWMFIVTLQKCCKMWGGERWPPALKSFLDAPGEVWDLQRVSDGFMAWITDDRIPTPQWLIIAVSVREEWEDEHPFGSYFDVATMPGIDLRSYVYSARSGTLCGFLALHSWSTPIFFYLQVGCVWETCRRKLG